MRDVDDYARDDLVVLVVPADFALTADAKELEVYQADDGTQRRDADFITVSDAP